jgi:DNA-binding response OmpR family regulator
MPKSVLLIEDDIIITDAYKIVLESEGFEVWIALDGEQGLRLAFELKPDFILLDMLMPKINGLEFLKKFNLKNHPETKILAFSNVDNGWRSEALKLGAEKYLIKSHHTPGEVVKMLKVVE